MTVKIGRNRNTNDEANVQSGIGLNSTTAVTIQAVNVERIFWHVDNDNAANAFWVRLYPAAQDDLKRGIFVSGRNGARPFWTMPPDEKYTGEISAIADTAAPTAFTTEY